MSIVINVGMDGTTREAAMAAILPLFTRCCLEFCTAPTGEDTLVVKGELKNDDTASVSLFNVCKPLNQDCIAIHWPYTRAGMLLGPNAAKWQPFDQDKFVFPDWMKNIQEEKPMFSF